MNLSTTSLMNKKAARTLLLMSLAVLVFSCTRKQQEKAVGFVVRGVLHHAGNNRDISIQEITTTGLVMIDTAHLSGNDSFELSGSIPEKTFCTIRLPKGDVLILLDTSTELGIEIDNDSIELYKFTGSPENEALRKLFLINAEYMHKSHELESKFAAYGAEVPPIEVQNRIRMEFDSMQRAHKEAVKAYSTQLEHSLVPYFTTNFLMPEADYEFFAMIDQKLYPEFGSSKYAISLHQRVEELKKTSIGSVAPDIVLSDPYGKTNALSSLRGKYVLLDFWASWCRPCREESPNMVRIYNKYKDHGLDLFS